MSTNRKPERILEFDATRGAAMFAVCLSHSSAFVANPAQSLFDDFLVKVGMIATPTFLLLSGFFCGYLSSRNNESSTRFAIRLIDRALFILLVGHTLFGIEHWTWTGKHSSLTSSFYITDSISIGLIVAALTAKHVSPKRFLHAGILLFMASWLMANVQSWHGVLAGKAARLLFGGYESSDDGYIVPLIPYLGIYLMGVAAGIEYVKQTALGRRLPDLCQRTLIAGLTCMGIAVVLKLTWLLSKPAIPADRQMFFYYLTDFGQKLPPSPSYLLTYGGAGIVMAATFVAMSNKIIMRRLNIILAYVGRASLVVFFAQYLLYFYPAYALHIGIGLWAVIFPPSLLILWSIAWVWDHCDGNRLLTSGLYHVWKNQKAKGFVAEKPDALVSGHDLAK